VEQMVSLGARQRDSVGVDWLGAKLSVGHRW
jgi:hypothetical protein